MTVFPERKVDPPEPDAPCECDVTALMHELAQAMDDAMYAHGLEWAGSVKDGEKALEYYINKVVGPVKPCDGGCK